MNAHFDQAFTLTEELETLLRIHGLFITIREPTRGNACLDTIAVPLYTWNYNVDVVWMEWQTTVRCFCSFGALPLVIEPFFYPGTKIICLVIDHLKRSCLILLRNMNWQPWFDENDF